MSDYNSLRKTFPEFLYKSYSYEFEDGALKIKYRFEIQGLETFEPEWSFPCPESVNQIPRCLLDNLVFSLGMVELISYWKATCSPIVRVMPHGLDNNMIIWWKKLYFGGLGEFFYVNGITSDFDTFMTISADGCVLSPSNDAFSLKGNLVPVGGGKDSAVTLSLLQCQKDVTLPYIINSRGATDNTCEVAGYGDKVYRVRRTIDKRLIELNKQGYLNGHTPFSAIVAFSSLIAALLNGKKYVVLSNESSANESTVLGADINHQFSKGIEFEKSFREYQSAYINCGVEYFSLLRPLSEMQIAMLFAQYKEYHKVFRSCNVGSKSDIWCCNCPKCLFVYIILSPFISAEEAADIFGKDLLDDKELIETYKELVGVLPNKPFECVGSRDEVLTASDYISKRFKAEGRSLPLILKYFENEVEIPHSNMLDYMRFFDHDNCLPKEFHELLIKELKERAGNVPQY